MRRKLLFLLSLVCITGCSNPLSRWVDPFIGTDYTGHTFPAASCPLGMVQPGPQTGNYAWKYCSGYNHSDSLILGFTQNRLSGTGVPSLGNVLIMPFSDGHGPEYASAKQDEFASPGRYSVRLPDNGAAVSITCSPRVACYEIDFTGRERVIDAYCGTGTTTLTFAGFVESITGVEINPEAVGDAVKNARVNDVKNAQFICADAVEYMEELAQAGETADCVILDPTRLGTDERFIKACEKLSPEKIVYISCNPDTLARDLKVFAACGYRARVAEPVDMFPWTSSIETVVLLSKLSNAPKLDINIKMSELDLTKAEAKATYEEIQEYVKKQTGLHVTHLNIAQIKRKYGIIERVNYNLPKSENSRQPNCPPEKEKAIVTALRYFMMI